MRRVRFHRDDAQLVLAHEEDLSGSQSMLGPYLVKVPDALFRSLT